MEGDVQLILSLGYKGEQKERNHKDSLSLLVPYIFIFPKKKSKLELRHQQEEQAGRWKPNWTLEVDLFGWLGIGAVIFNWHLNVVGLATPCSLHPSILPAWPLKTLNFVFLEYFVVLRKMSWFKKLPPTFPPITSIRLARQWWLTL